MGTHKDDIDVLRKAFRDGASTIRDALSMPQDRDLASYQKLSESDFDDMMKNMGSEATVDYIRRMETRGMGIKDKKHG